MTLKLYNTRTRTKEEFQPLDPGNVRMYVCGPTVYDYAHIGNARPVIVFDVLYRLLRHLYGESHVTYVRNITDVDDKINARAAEQYPDMPPEAAIRKLTEETAAQYQRDVAALGCLPPTHEPRATEYINQMKAMVETLIDKGCAYVAENHVLFDVPAMPGYGQLARRSLREMRAGARIEVAPYKRNSMDFVLWKPSKDGEPSWPSPHGINAPGRPGWHLECSAMSKALLGETFDIHGGGIDLVFPHHENEVAQSRCAHGTDIMANVWIHNGFLQVDGEKMSKSLGNFVTIHELLTSWRGKPWAGSVLRLAMLSTHYRQPIDWTYDLLEKARLELAEWCQAVLPEMFTKYDPYRLAWEEGFEPPVEIVNALSEDLNFPNAHSEIRKLHSSSIGNNEEDRLKLLMALQFLGFIKKNTVGALSGRLRGNVLAAANNAQIDDLRAFQVHVANNQTTEVLSYFRAFRSSGVTAEPDDRGIITIEYEDGGGNLFERLIAQRNEARKAKNWAEADRIRDELAAMGIALKDTKDPASGEIVTTWEIAR